MPTAIRYQKIMPQNLINPNAFRLWIKENLGHLYIRQNIPVDHLLIYLDYVRQTISKNEQIDVPFWMDMVRKLESEIKSIKKVEE